MTFNEVVRDEAAKQGVTLDHDQAAALLWETGYPSFWHPDESIEYCLRRQVREILADTKADYEQSMADADRRTK